MKSSTSIFSVLLGVIMLFSSSALARKKDERPIVKALEGDTISLSCDHGSVSTDTLYAVKWYKDEKEFFRNYPKAENPVKVYPIEGFTLEEPTSSPWQVVLKNVNESASGKYTCMVVDYPRYRTIYRSTQVDVASKNMTLHQQHPPDAPGRRLRSDASSRHFNCLLTSTLLMLSISAMFF